MIDARFVVPVTLVVAVVLLGLAVYLGVKNGNGRRD